MADLSDVEEALIHLIAAVLYPSGPDEPGLLDGTYRIYRGWPNPAGLNADLVAGVVNVTVFPDTSIGNTTTRFSNSWHADPDPPELVPLANGDSIVFTGRCQVGQQVGLMVDGKTYVYLPQDGDTPDVVAAVLGNFIREDRPATVAGATLSLPGVGQLTARVVMSTTGFQEVRRQERDIRMAFWCPTASLRDVVVSAVDREVARHAFVAINNQAYARLRYTGTAIFDQSQNDRLYRRDLIYVAEYPTIISDNLPAMLFGNMTLNATDVVA